MRTKDKIPKQIYVTSKKYEQSELDWVHYNLTGEYRWTVTKEYRFGFLCPHEPSKKTDVKRKNTQKGWAYGTYSEDNGKIIQHYGTWQYFDELDANGRKVSKYVIKTEIVPEEYQPVVLDNVPTKGFEIIDTVSRYSTSNKLVKVLDPRGYVFEITIASLFEIMRQGSIVHGIIQEPCVWKANKNLIIYEGE